MVGNGGTKHPPASGDGVCAAILLLGVSAFQIALAAGAPWGAAAYGGSNPGVVPTKLRRSSAVAAGVYAALAGVAGTRLASATVRRRVLTGAAPVLAAGTLLNLASPSLIERLLWTPTTAALAVTLWRAARHPALVVRGDSSRR